ncbi:MAG: hypothetical protein DSY58_00550, partial [Desulfobulbus sp.]
MHELNQYQLGQRLLLILFYGLLAKLADLFIDKLLLRFAVSTRWKADERIMEILHRPICWSIFLLGITHALLLSPPLPSPWDTILPRIIKTFILMVWWISLIQEITAMNENNMSWVLQKIDKTHFY